MGLGSRSLHVRWSMYKVGLLRYMILLLVTPGLLLRSSG